MFSVDLGAGWSAVPQTSGVSIKPLSGDFDESAGKGFRTRYVKFAPGGETFAPFTHNCWEEALLIEGEIAQKATGKALRAPAYVIRPPGAPHGPLRSEGGCLMIEAQYFADRAVGLTAFRPQRSGEAASKSGR
jgi:hypothetical protein